MASTVQTGQVNHRGICGNQFYVRDGRVSMETRQHRHKCPACGTAVWSARLSGGQTLLDDVGKPLRSGQGAIRQF